MVLAQVAIQPRWQPVDVRDEQIGLEGVQTAARRARALERHHARSREGRAVDAENRAQDDRQRLEGERRLRIERARRPTTGEKLEEAAVPLHEGQLGHLTGRPAGVEGRRRRPPLCDELLEVLAPNGRELLDGLSARGGGRSQVDSLPPGQEVKERGVWVPPRLREELVALTALFIDRVDTVAEDETAVGELGETRLVRLDPLVGRQRDD